jgi:uridine kinase
MLGLKIVFNFTFMNDKYLIGISGGSGSGKTSFLKSIRQQFSTEEVCIISQDDYYLPREHQEIDPNGIFNFDKPESIDLNAFFNDLTKLKSNQVVHRQEYTFNNEKANAGILSFQPAPVIIVEGIFVFHHEPIRNLLNLKIFLHAKENLKVIRRIKRDQTERNYPLEDVLYRYEHHVLPTFERYILPYKEMADIVINNNIHFQNGVKVISGFISSLLKSD